MRLQGGPLQAMRDRGRGVRATTRRRTGGRSPRPATPAVPRRGAPHQGARRVRQRSSPQSAPSPWLASGTETTPAAARREEGLAASRTDLRVAEFPSTPCHRSLPWRAGSTPRARLDRPSRSGPIGLHVSCESSARNHRSREHAPFRGRLASRAGRLGAGHDEPGLVGDDDRLRAIPQSELAQHMAYVRLDRLVAENEAVCDLAIGTAGRDGRPVDDRSHAEHLRRRRPRNAHRPLAGPGCRVCVGRRAPRPRLPRAALSRRLRRGKDPARQRLRGADQIRTGVRGFAGLCLTTRPRRRASAGHGIPGLRHPAFERRRELELVRPGPRRLLVEVLDGAGHVFHRG